MIIISQTLRQQFLFFCLDSSSAFSFTEDKHAFVLYWLQNSLKLVKDGFISSDRFIFFYLWIVQFKYTIYSTFLIPNWKKRNNRISTAALPINTVISIKFTKNLCWFQQMKNKRTGFPPDLKAILRLHCTLFVWWETDGWMRPYCIFKIKLLLMNADMNCQTL